MAVITSDYAVPTRFTALYDVTDNGDSYKSVPPDQVMVPAGGMDLHLAWSSTYSTFQAQYRIRKRLTPANAAVTSPAGGDVWTDWGDWTGTVEDGKVADIQGGGTYGARGWRYLTDAIRIDYGYTAYDAWEIDLRVRVYNTPNYHTTEWAYCTYKVGFDIKASVGAEETADGGIKLTINTDWQRNQLGMTLRWDWGGHGMYFSSSRLISSSDPTFDVDAACCVVDPDGTRATRPNYMILRDDMGRECRTTFDSLKKWDAALGVINTPYYEVKAGTHVDSESIPAPTMALADDDGSLDVTVTPESGTYDSVIACARWTDWHGMQNAVTLDMDADGSAWKGELAEVPLDTVVTVTAAVIKDGEWRKVIGTHKVKSWGNAYFEHGGERFKIRYDQTHSLTGKPGGEQIEVAGRPRPVSRHSEQASRSITVDGTLVTGGPDTDQTEASADVLFASHDWMLRLPGGYRSMVAVTQFATSDSGFYDAVKIEVSCEEVDG